MSKKGVFKDLTGLRFGRLLVIKRAEDYISKDGKGKVRWYCVCDCGDTKTVWSLSLVSGNTKSCGCIHKEVTTRHGMKDSRAYNIWKQMKSRCNNSSTMHYEYYGGRGITYDPKWEDFIGFWEDMEVGYSDDLTLDRIDVNGVYCKSNCRWISMQLQAQNQRIRKDNKTGKAGVSLVYVNGIAVKYKASWVVSKGKSKTKTFSIRKYGKQGAFRLACSERDKQISILNSEGAVYNVD